MYKVASRTSTNLALEIPIFCNYFCQFYFLICEFFIFIFPSRTRSST